jgi:hypothetical protein
LVNTRVDHVRFHRAPNVVKDYPFRVILALGYVGFLAGREKGVMHKIALSCPRRENLASRRGPFGRFYSGKEAPKPHWAEIAMDAA